MNKPLNKMAVQATINGESTAFLCSPGQVLAEVLRDELDRHEVLRAARHHDVRVALRRPYEGLVPVSYTHLTLPTKA